MNAAGRDSNDHVIGSNGRAIDQLFFLDDANTKTGQIVVSGLVVIRHDSRFTTEQCTIGLQAAITDASYDLLKRRRIVMRHGHVVQKEQRLGTTTDRIVDAHRHQINSDGVVFVSHAGQFQFCSNTVGAGDQHGIDVVAAE